MSDDALKPSPEELRSETPRAEKLRVRWRPEVDFCVPVYCIGAVTEIVLFFFCLLYLRKPWYQTYHTPVMMSCWCLPATVFLGIVTLSPLDDDALHNDPDYSSNDPQLRAAAIRRQLKYAEILWKVCICINALASAVLLVAYGAVAWSSHRDRAAERIPLVYPAYAGGMASLFGLCIAANLAALRRVARAGRRAFTAGLDALTMEAEVLLGAGMAPAPEDADEPAGEPAAGAEATAGLRRRRAAGAAEEPAQPAAAPAGAAPAGDTPLALATAAARQFLQGNLDQEGLEDVLRQLGVDLSRTPELVQLVARHASAGDGDWLEVARALEEALRGIAVVPPKPLEEAVLRSDEAKPGQA